MPLFAGIYRKGAGLGPAITFLFVGPAINILALAYTGVALGMDIAVARVLLSVVFGIGIGLIMALTFSRDDLARDQGGRDAFAGDTDVRRSTWIFFLLLIALLITGTLQVGLLTESYAQFALPIGGMDRFQSTLNRWVPYDASRGEEGVTVQGFILILLLVVIGVSAWFGLNSVDEGYNAWTWVSLASIGVTLIVAAVRMVPHAGGLDVLITGKMAGVLVAMIALGTLAWRAFDEYEIQEWLWETWRFVKQIFPLLVVGVFAVGVIRGLINPQWIQALAGRNTVVASLVGVLFGVFMYFPTLVEVPIANMFLSLGMHRGPLLAYLMADPELSLQSILITSSVMGKAKTWVYVGWVTVFSTLAGLIYGAWIDGVSHWLLLAYLIVGVAALLASLSWIGRHQRAGAEATAQATAH
jgi:uncharacterized membrane protein YraQ (UPF0718 family)